MKIYNKREIVIINRDITEDTIWSSDNEYLITAEVHVRYPAILTILNGTRVLFQQWPLRNASSTGLPFASLVVDSGASICAENVSFNAQFRGVQTTGGVVISGTLATGQFETFPTIVSTDSVPPGNSRLINCTFNHLGNITEDINALTLFNVTGTPELELSNISINDAGDDALEIFGGNHVINNLFINNATDDGLDLDSNATLTITERITIVKRAAFGNPVSENNGNGLVEVIGGPGTVNTVNFAAGSVIFFIGRLTDTTIGMTQFSGSFAGAVAGEISEYDILSALPNTYISGSNPPPPPPNC